MSNVKGILRMAVISLYPWTIWRKETGSYYCTGSLCHMVYTSIHFLRKLNFNVELLHCPGKEIGYEISPGNWTSAIGMLARQEADVFGGFFSISARLNEFVGFTTAFDDFQVTILSGPPLNLDQKIPSLFSAVSMTVWTMLGLFWLFVSCLYLFLSRAEISMSDNRSKEKPSLAEYLLTFYGLLFQRGFENLPVTACRRLLVSGWLVFVVIFTVELSGALASKLAVEEVPERIESFKDILKNPVLKPYISKGMGIDYMFQASDNTEFQGVWRLIQKYETMRSYEDFFGPEILDEVSAGSAVFVGHKESHVILALDSACRRKVQAFHLAKEVVHALPFVGFFRKGLPHHVIEVLNQAYAVYGSMGFQLPIYQEFRRYAAPCLDKKMSQIKYSSTSVASIWEAFKVLGIGLLVSSTALVVEKIYANIV